jgi:hypothetical protein
MMSGEAWLYLLAVLINAVNLFLQVFFTIMYSDLEWCVLSLFFPPSLCRAFGKSRWLDKVGPFQPL